MINRLKLSGQSINSNKMFLFGGEGVSSNKLLLGEPSIYIIPTYYTLFTLDDSIGDSGTTPMNGYYSNYYLEYYQPGIGGTEVLRTIDIDAAGQMTYDSSIAYSYPTRCTSLNGMVFITKSVGQSISSFYLNPNTGSISLWKNNSFPLIPRTDGYLGSCQGKLIQAANGASNSVIEVYSYTTDSSGTLTRDSSLTFSTVYTGSSYNKRLISGKDFCYLMRVADGSVAHTDILTISGGVLTDTGYDISVGGVWEDLLFDAFEDNGYLYSSYNGSKITKHQIHIGTGNPALINEVSSPYIGIYSNLINGKIINESNDDYTGVNGFLKSYDEATFTLDGSFVHNANTGKFHSGITKIDNSTFITSRNAIAGGHYFLETFTLTFNQ
jgi:hypothetical protein